MNTENLVESNRSRIYVSVCSYRDPLLIDTVTSLLDNCSGEHNICVGIFEQTVEKDSLLGLYPEFLEQYDKTQTEENQSLIRKGILYKRIDPVYSDGVGWARAINQCQMDTDKYDFIYQVDSHMLFDKNWDLTLLEDYHEAVKLAGHTRVGITGPCKVFDFDNNTLNMYPTHDVGGMVKFPQYFTEHYMLNATGVFTPPQSIPTIANHIFAGNSFFPAIWVQEVGNDIEMFFDAEEFKLTLKSFISGYQVFFGKKLCCYHYRDVHQYPTKQWVEPLNTNTRYARNVWRSHCKWKKFLESIPKEKLVEFAELHGIDYINRTILPKALI